MCWHARSVRTTASRDRGQGQPPGRRTNDSVRPRECLERAAVDRLIDEHVSTRHAGADRVFRQCCRTGAHLHAVRKSEIRCLTCASNLDMIVLSHVNQLTRSHFPPPQLIIAHLSVPIMMYVQPLICKVHQDCLDEPTQPSRPDVAWNAPGALAWLAPVAERRIAGPALIPVIVVTTWPAPRRRVFPTKLVENLANVGTPERTKRFPSDRTESLASGA